MNPVDGGTTGGRGRLGSLPVNADFDTVLAAAQRGDSDAFAALWRMFHPPLYRYLRVVAAPICDDAAAETWFQVARHLPSFSGGKEAFQGWLFTIARHRVIDWKRRLMRRPETLVGLHVVDSPAIESDPAEIFDEKSATDAALALIAVLPPAQAEAVMLRTVAGLSVSMTAKLMNRSPGSVRVLCHRGLRQLAGTTSNHDTPEVVGAVS
ncbi:MAG TPA: RNA polymerase sigma factor [Acidimicrobiales bacterium]|nr:RNA polymerase sigma factor [Acidimicrobiales bacterium]